MSIPIGFAHRGARALEPDNTIRSFTRALAIGATALESDVWVTADGVAVLDHDGRIGPRMRSSKIRDTAYADMPAHIPSLQTLYEVCGTDFSLSLDIKDPKAVVPVLETTQAAGGDAMVSRLWLCHPKWETVRSWREFSTLVRLVDSTRLRKIDEGFESRVKRLVEARINAINMHHRDWNASRVATAKTQGLITMAWDLQRPADLDRLLAMKIDAVFSDHVDRMISAISRRVTEKRL